MMFGDRKDRWRELQRGEGDGGIIAVIIVVLVVLVIFFYIVIPVLLLSLMYKYRYEIWEGIRIFANFTWRVIWAIHLAIARSFQYVSRNFVVTKFWTRQISEFENRLAIFTWVVSVPILMMGMLATSWVLALTALAVPVVVSVVVALGSSSLTLEAYRRAYFNYQPRSAVWLDHLLPSHIGMYHDLQLEYFSQRLAFARRYLRLLEWSISLRKEMEGFFKKSG